MVNCEKGLQNLVDMVYLLFIVEIADVISITKKRPAVKNNSHLFILSPTYKKTIKNAASLSRDRHFQQFRERKSVGLLVFDSKGKKLMTVPQKFTLKFQFYCELSQNSHYFKILKISRQ